jgi:hypothetical protein
MNTERVNWKWVASSPTAPDVSLVRLSLRAFAPAFQRKLRTTHVPAALVVRPASVVLRN